MSEKLKPCPFCGHKTIQESFFDLPCKVYRIRCPSCYIFMDNTSENMVMKAWNERPIEDALQKQAERTPQEKAAHEMYEFIEMLTAVSGQVNIAAGNVSEIVGIAREILKKARGDK